MSLEDGEVIVTRGLTKRYGPVVAVDGVDLTVHRGEVFGLLGPNGAGKTTTILLLLGLTEPTAGTARVAGIDPLREPLEVKRRVGYLPDNAGFYDELSGRQNLRYTARLNRLAARHAEERIDALLDEVGLRQRADDPVRAYSRGMRQRLGVADALVKDPEILILDEPTVGIDPAGVDDMLALIGRLPAERGVTVLVSSHLLDQVQATCHRMGIFSRGRLVAQGTLGELAGDGTGHVEIHLEVDGPGAEPVLRGVPGVVDVEGSGVTWTVIAWGDVRPALSRALVAAGFAILQLGARRQALGEIYRRYFREDPA